MAQKRMFDRTITNSDDFLDLPDSSQVLYFHLSMNADDDGFINNWKSIVRMTGTKQDDLKILVAKQFVIPFDSGVIVIKHWRINNYLRNDRYKETKYKKELSLLTADKNEEYQLKNNSGIPVVYPDKNRIDKNRIDNIYVQNEQDNFERLWKMYPNKKGKERAKKSYLCAKKDKVTDEEIEQGIKNYIDYIKFEEIEPRYIKNGSTWFNQRCWQDDYTIKRKLNTDDIAKVVDITEVWR